MSDSLKIFLRVAPKSAANRIQGWQETPDGGKILKVAVTAAPEKGKANQALVEFLAKTWGISKSSIDIVKGTTESNKVIEIKEEKDALKQIEKDLAVYRGYN